MRPLDIVIPFYRNAALATDLCRSLEDVRRELSENCCSILAVNDSPDDPALAAVLAALPKRLAPHVPVELLVNERNLGFVNSRSWKASAPLRAAYDLWLRMKTQ